MAEPYGTGMSENDVLVEMHRLRGELSEVRERMGRQRSSSFRRRGPTTGQLRNRAGAALLTALGLAIGGSCWLLYRLLAETVGGLFDGLLPHPVRVTVAAVIEIAGYFL